MNSSPSEVIDVASGPRVPKDTARFSAGLRARKALELAKAFLPDLALLDIGMPVMNG